MNKRPDLLGRLMDYGKSDFYPFHMPGHKRQDGDGFSREFPNPFSIDITEIEGFDNLHHPEGILKESMEWAAGIYGADRTYYLVNGSSSGILSAICGTTSYGGTILMSRNCHKSAYHGVFLNHLTAEYVYPQVIEDFGILGGLVPEEIEEMLIRKKEVQAVLVVSPTYDGIVSDIEKIAEIVHRHGLPLIVDEAHGAHFPYGEEFPVSAFQLGADVVIQSLHKTLPSFTQTAVMHVKKGFVDMEKIDRYIHIYQSSSPSYVLMAGIENCIRWMEEDGRGRMKDFYGKLMKLRKKLLQMKHLRLLDGGEIRLHGVFDMDPAKLIISTRKTKLTGAGLQDMLREKYHLEMEMCGTDYVTAITTVADTEEGFRRLCEALLDIDGKLEKCSRMDDFVDNTSFHPELCGWPMRGMTIAEALDSQMVEMELSESEGNLSGEYLFIYPPGIPLIAPGEMIHQCMIDLVADYKRMGLSVQGTRDESAQRILVVRKG